MVRKSQRTSASRGRSRSVGATPSVREAPTPVSARIDNPAVSPSLRRHVLFAEEKQAEGTEVCAPLPPNSPAEEVTSSTPMPGVGSMATLTEQPALFAGVSMTPALSTPATSVGVRESSPAIAGTPITIPLIGGLPDLAVDKQRRGKDIVSSGVVISKEIAMDPVALSRAVAQHNENSRLLRQHGVMETDPAFLLPISNDAKMVLKQSIPENTFGSSIGAFTETQYWTAIQLRVQRYLNLAGSDTDALIKVLCTTCIMTAPTGTQSLIECFEVHVSELEMALNSTAGVTTGNMLSLVIPVLIRGLRPGNVYREVMYQLKMRYQEDSVGHASMLKSPQETISFVKRILLYLDLRIAQGEVTLKTLPMRDLPERSTNQWALPMIVYDKDMSEQPTETGSKTPGKSTSTKPVPSGKSGKGAGKSSGGSTKPVAKDSEKSKRPAEAKTCLCFNCGDANATHCSSRCPAKCAVCGDLSCNIWICKKDETKRASLLASMRNGPVTKKPKH